MMEHTMTIPSDLKRSQTIILVLYGVIVWFLAAMLVRVIAPIGALDGWWRALTYALVVPGTVPAIWIARAIAKLARGQTATGIMVATAPALMLDGVAFAWFPALYGPDPAHWLAGAALILWGAGVGLVLSIVMNRN
jgi:hypothetical protein